MFKKILVCLLFTGLLAGCPAAEAQAHPTDEAGAKKWTKRSGIRFGYVYANKADHPDSDGEESRLTLDAGVFSVPVHFSFVPDVNDYWATAITTGVNW